jgi:1-acyl-sn-glycerol-3-phosphate acyltransferase
MKERGSNTVSETLWTLAKAVRFEVNDPNKNIDLAKKHLETGSLLLYTNHFSTLDTTVIAKFIEESFGLDRLSIIAARKYFDAQRGTSYKVKKEIIESFAEAKGFEILQVVQKNELDLYEDASPFNRSSLIKAVRNLNKEGRIVAIAPEGTRSRSGGLREAQDGIDLLFKLSRDKAIALPLAMHPYKIIPGITKTNVEVGVPFSFYDLEMERAQKPGLRYADLMMQHVAELLPPQFRGYYNKV